MTRSSYLGGPESVRLDFACEPITAAFGENCYLVGSATETREFRDVDVRIILNDERYEAVFGTCPPTLSPLRNLIDVAISAYLSQQTGLRVDFQIQKRTQVKESDWKKHRMPLGHRTVQRDPDDNWLGPPWMKPKD